MLLTRHQEKTSNVTTSGPNLYQKTQRYIQSHPPQKQQTTRNNHLSRQSPQHRSARRKLHHYPNQHRPPTKNERPVKLSNRSQSPSQTTRSAPNLKTRQTNSNGNSTAKSTYHNLLRKRQLLRTNRQRLQSHHQQQHTTAHNQTTRTNNSLK